LLKSGTNAGNYAITKVEGTLTVTKAAMTLSNPGFSGKYDGNAHGEAAKCSVEDATITYSTDNGTTWSSDVPTLSKVGKLNVIAKAVKANYYDAKCSYVIDIKSSEKKSHIPSSGSGTGSSSGTQENGPQTAVDRKGSFSRVESINWNKGTDGSWGASLAGTKLTSILVNAVYPVAGVNTTDWFYFDANGKMATGWELIKDGWYYFDTTGNRVGAMRTGWLEFGGKKYYLLPSLDTNYGKMATGWIKDGDKWYYLHKDGSMATNTRTPDGYRVDSNGAWIQ